MIIPEPVPMQVQDGVDQRESFEKAALSRTFNRPAALSFIDPSQRMVKPSHARSYSEIKMPKVRPQLVAFQPTGCEESSPTDFAVDDVVIENKCLKHHIAQL